MAPTVFDLRAGLPPGTAVPSAAIQAAIAGAVAALRSGSLVLLPTETVYGLAAAVEARERLLGVGGRPSHQPLTLHLGDAAQAPKHGVFGPRVARLAQRYWPGPLTLVVPNVDPRQDPIGLRVPAHPVTSEVLRAVGGAWIASASANRSDGAPIARPDDIAAAFGDELAVVLDDGPAPEAPRSTVLWCVGPDFKVLRQGALPRDQLLRTAARSVLFVCTGNTCRSPLAEALARQMLCDALDLTLDQTGTADSAPRDPVLARGLAIASAGVAAMPGFPASEGSTRAAAEAGLDLSGHRSTPLDIDGIEQAHLIYCLSASHRSQILDAVPSAAGKVHLLHPQGGDIADPFGGDDRIYRAARDQIETAVRARVPDLIAAIEA